MKPYQRIRRERQLKEWNEKKVILGYTDLSDDEIRSKTPIAYVTLYRNKITKLISAEIKSCPLCGKSHNHSWNLSCNGEYRVPRCEPIEGIIYPQNYKVVIDWENRTNQRFSEEYFKRLTLCENTPKKYSESIIWRYIYNIQRKCLSMWG